MSSRGGAETRREELGNLKAGSETSGNQMSNPITLEAHWKSRTFLKEQYVLQLEVHLEKSVLGMTMNPSVLP